MGFFCGKINNLKKNKSVFLFSFTVQCQLGVDMKGYLITFEGPDGAGKTTVINELIKQLPKEIQKKTIITREPGGSKISENIRTIILDPANKEMDDRTEALLYAAQRSQHVSEVIRPALAAGKIVLSDRFIDSSLAYQGVGRDLGVEVLSLI